MNFLDVDLLGFLIAVHLFLLPLHLEPVLSVIQNFAYRRIGVLGNADQIEVVRLGHLQGPKARHHAERNSVGSDYAHVRETHRFIHQIAVVISSLIRPLFIEIIDKQILLKIKRAEKSPPVKNPFQNAVSVDQSDKSDLVRNGRFFFPQFIYAIILPVREPFVNGYFRFASIFSFRNLSKIIRKGRRKESVRKSIKKEKGNQSIESAE